MTEPDAYAAMEHALREYFRVFAEREVAAERERCATVVREFEDYPLIDGQMERIAAKIMEGRVNDGSL